MVGNNLNKMIFPFFDSVKNPVSAAGTSDPMYLHQVYDSMVIEVSGATAITMTVEGCVNTLNADGTFKTDDECVWTPLAMTNLADASTVKSIAANGIYSLPCLGLSRIRAVVSSVSGSATIVGVAGR